MLQQEREILKSFAQRWQMDVDDVEAVEEIFTKLSHAHGVTQVTVGRGDQPHIDRFASGGAQWAYLFVFDYPEQLSLSLQGQFANLIEKGRAAMRRHKETGLVLPGISECSALVPKQLALQQRLGNGSTVDRYKRRLLAAAVVMEGARDAVLAGRYRFPPSEARSPYGL
jgi:hypothetical protein